MDPERFVRGGPTWTIFFFFSFFFVDEGREDPSTTICESLSARWLADNGPTLNAGFLALGFFRGPGPVLLENPKFL